MSLRYRFQATAQTGDTAVLCNTVSGHPRAISDLAWADLSVALSEGARMRGLPSPWIPFRFAGYPAQAALVSRFRRGCLMELRPNTFSHIGNEGVRKIMQFSSGIE